LLKGVWAESQTERILRLIAAVTRQISSNDNDDNSLSRQCSMHTDVLDAMKKEFKRSSLLWQAQKDRLSRLDELDMAIMRLRVREPWEEVLPGEEAFKLQPYEVDQQRHKFISDRISAEDTMKHCNAQLKYLCTLHGSRPLMLSIC